MSRVILKCLIVIVVVSCPSLVKASIILPPGATWEHTFTDPTGDSTWNTTNGVGGIWSYAAAPFGNQTGGDFGYNTFWAADGFDGDDLWARVAIDFSDIDLATVVWSLGVDNGYKLYANGTFISGDNAEGYTSRWEYQGGFGNSLVQGVNIIAVALEDHGGATAFDMQITGDVNQSVPEPSSVGLWAVVAFAGLTTWRRRQRASKTEV